MSHSKKYKIMVTFSPILVAVVTILLVRLVFLIKHEGIVSNSQKKYAPTIVSLESKMQITSSPSMILDDVYPAGTNGYAISWPQCGKRIP